MRIISGKYGRRRFDVPTNIKARPTTDFARENIFNVLENLIDFKGIVLFATHDHEFAQTVANRIIEIQPEGGVFDRMTTFDEYLEMRGKV